jgi:hypothetical protein
MAYEGTEVPVSRSQEGIRKLVMGRKGGKVAFITDPPREGFSAVVEIDGLPYQIRIFGVCREPVKNCNRSYRGSTELTAKQIFDFQSSEERRIWRVLFYHMKNVFEAADSGVMEFRELMLPYIVTKSGMTISEQLLPNLAKAIESNPSRLLGAGA